MCHLYVCGLGTRHARFKREWVTTGKASYAPETLQELTLLAFCKSYTKYRKMCKFCHIGNIWQFFAILGIILNLPHVSSFLQDVFVKDFHIVLSENFVLYFAWSIFCSFNFASVHTRCFMLIICYLSAYLCTYFLPNILRIVYNVVKVKHNRCIFLLLCLLLPF